MQQAQDFLAESATLDALLEPLSEADLELRTAFKGWTPNDIIRHLHVWNQAAMLSLTDAESFHEFYSEVVDGLQRGSMSTFERERLGGLSGHALIRTWRECFVETAERFDESDPSMRVVWAGPGMSARSSITARLMETWAHGQAIYDLLGIVRKNDDRIRNIVILGLNTYGWTFTVHGQDVPEPVPHLRLTAPSGAEWSFGEPNDTERIEGKAEEFCQVVTQTRNVADTNLLVVGPNAKAWMMTAQCFAGPPETPPAPGVRTTAVASSRR